MSVGLLDEKDCQPPFGMVDLQTEMVQAIVSSPRDECCGGVPYPATFFMVSLSNYKRLGVGARPEAHLWRD
jgi:hypothetical protein